MQHVKGNIDSLIQFLDDWKHQGHKRNKFSQLAYRLIDNCHYSYLLKGCIERGLELYLVVPILAFWIWF